MAVNKVSVCSASEYKCAICLQLLIEPVVLPCKHEMCRPCFRKNVEEGNFVCPMCRKRIASWARKCIREGTLVDQNRWNLIQKLFPKKCLKRLQGDDDESEDEAYQPPPKRLAKSGELRQEYEQEMNKILQVQEKEEQASKDLIKNILEEEQALQLQQEKEDEQLARKLSEEFKQTQDNKEGSSKTGDDTTKMNSKDLKRKKISTKCQRRSYTLDKYFFSKDKDSGNSLTSNPNNNVPDEQRHKSDYDLALALQKQFDHEAVAANKRDEYMLRKSTPDNNYSKHTEKNGQNKLGKQKNGHSYTRGEQVRDKMLVQVNGDNTLLIDEEKIKVGNPQIQSKEMRILRDRTILTSTIKLGEQKNNNHEL